MAIVLPREAGRIRQSHTPLNTLTDVGPGDTAKALVELRARYRSLRRRIRRDEGMTGVG